MSHELAGGIEPSAYPLLGELVSFSDSPPLLMFRTHSVRKSISSQ
jgi:hypothetical protein